MFGVIEQSTSLAFSGTDNDGHTTTHVPFSIAYGDSHSPLQTPPVHVSLVVRMFPSSQSEPFSPAQGTGSARTWATKRRARAARARRRTMGSCTPDMSMQPRGVSACTGKQEGRRKMLFGHVRGALCEYWQKNRDRRQGGKYRDKRILVHDRARDLGADPIYSKPRGAPWVAYHAPKGWVGSLVAERLSEAKESEASETAG